MPPDLLMPAFVLVLVANAVLIVLAMRSLMPARDPADAKPSPAPRADRMGTATAAAPRQAPVAAPSASSLQVGPADPTPAAGPVPAIATGAAVTTSSRGGTATKARKPAARAAAVGAATRAATKTRSP